MIAEDEQSSNFDVRNLFLDYLSIYISKQNNAPTIKQLLESDILMLNKLGLYGISKNLEENKENSNRKERVLFNPLDSAISLILI